MATLTVRIPDDTYARLKQLARRRGLSVNKLFEQLSTTALAEFDVETRFLVRASRGDAATGLEILERLERESR